MPKFSLRWRKKAGADLELSADYISQDNPAAAQELREHCQNEQIAINPESLSKR
jgi:plasmid stabilization system protein ParE